MILCILTSRDPAPCAELGPFKWGVGKIVANQQKLPVIIPFYHMGMEHVRDRVMIWMWFVCLCVLFFWLWVWVTNELSSG